MRVLRITGAQKGQNLKKIIKPERAAEKLQNKMLSMKTAF